VTFAVPIAMMMTSVTLPSAPGFDESSPPLAPFQMIPMPAFPVNASEDARLFEVIVQQVAEAIAMAGVSGAGVAPASQAPDARAAQMESLYDDLARLCRARFERPDDEVAISGLRNRLDDLRRLEAEEAQEIEREWRRAHPLPPIRDDEAVFVAAREVVNASAPPVDRAASDSDDENT
jgi:hypothetical protein